MHVTYLTIEDIESGLFRTQVIDMLVEIANLKSDVEIEILVVNRFWRLRSHLNSKRRIQAELNSSLRLRYIPLLPPLRHALKWSLYSAAVTQWLCLIYRLFVRRRTDVMHCRSYWPAQAALSAGFAPVIFDMRSLWILENISMGNLQENSGSHRYWYELERECLHMSHVTTGVSKSMVEYAEGIAPGKTIELIPISVDMQRFRFDEAKRRKNREVLGWEGKTVLVYSGSFGMSDINSGALKTLIGSLMGCTNARLLLLTMEPEEKVVSLLEGIGAVAAECRVVHPAHDEIADWLSTADIGIHALPLQLDSSTRLGTKVVEYWACGLPVIVNENVGAAAELIREQGVGAVLDADALGDHDRLEQLLASLAGKNRQEQIDFASRNFSTKVVAQKYLDAFLRCQRSKSASHPQRGFSVC